MINLDFLTSASLTDWFIDDKPLVMLIIISRWAPAPGIMLLDAGPVNEPERLGGVGADHAARIGVGVVGADAGLLVVIQGAAVVHVELSVTFRV